MSLTSYFLPFSLFFPGIQSSSLILVAIPYGGTFWISSIIFYTEYACPYGHTIKPHLVYNSVIQYRQGLQLLVHFSFLNAPSIIRCKLKAPRINHVPSLLSKENKSLSLSLKQAAEREGVAIQNKQTKIFKIHLYKKKEKGI